MRRLLLFLLFAVALCSAQTVTHAYPALDTNNLWTGTNQFMNLCSGTTGSCWTVSSGAPTGVCLTGSFDRDIVSGNAWSCKLGVWVQDSTTGGGGGGATLPSSGIVKATSPTTGVAATASDIVTLLGTTPVNNATTSSTSSALAATPSLCPTGQAPVGVLSNGNATGCASITGGGSMTGPQIVTALDTTPVNNASSAASVDGAANAGRICLSGVYWFSASTYGGSDDWEFCENGTSGTLKYLDATSSIQTQLNSKPTAVLDTDGTLAANSDTRVPSQKAVVTYVTAHSGGGGTGGSGGVTALPCTGTCLYVAPTGTDNSTCGTTGAPCATPDYAVNSRASAGTTVSVAAGTYSYSTPMTLTASGTSGSHIVVQCQTRWACYITSTTATGDNGKVVLIDSQYLTFDGFDVTDTGGGTTNVNNGIQVGNGSGSQGVGVTVSHCRVHDIHPVCDSNGGGAISVYVAGSTVNVTLNANVIYNYGFGYSPCTSTTQYQSHGINMESNGSATITNNLIYNTTGWGIQYQGTINGGSIANNTILSAYQGGIVPYGTVTNLPIINNIILNTGSLGTSYGVDLTGNANNSTITVANNLLSGNVNGNFGGTGFTPANSITTVNPSSGALFVNYQANGSGDYHLAAGSPALAAGTSSHAPSTDLDGTAQTSPPSIGAYAGGDPASTTAFNPAAPGPIGGTTPAAGTFTTVVVGATVSEGSPSANETIAAASGTHGLFCDEGTTAGIPKPGVDYMRCDGTSHSFVYSCNGSAESNIPCGVTTTAPGTASMSTPSVLNAQSIALYCDGESGMRGNTLTADSALGTTAAQVNMGGTYAPYPDAATAKLYSGHGTACYMLTQQPALKGKVKAFANYAVNGYTVDNGAMVGATSWCGQTKAMAGPSAPYDMAIYVAFLPGLNDWAGAEMVGTEQISVPPATADHVYAVALAGWQAAKAAGCTVVAVTAPNRDGWLANPGWGEERVRYNHMVRNALVATPANTTYGSNTYSRPYDILWDWDRWAGKQQSDLIYGTGSDGVHLDPVQHWAIAESIAGALVSGSNTAPLADSGTYGRWNGTATVPGSGVWSSLSTYGDLYISTSAYSCLAADTTNYLNHATCTPTSTSVISCTGTPGDTVQIYCGGWISAAIQ